MTRTVLILGGNGKIGSHSATAFWNAGWQVRHYDRASGDMTAAAQGVDVIVNGLNPPHYHDWATLIPQITDQVIAAARASGATVILPGNIYNFGDRTGALDENTPQTATTRKGRIRISMEQSYRAAGIPTIVLRAGNFITPDGNGDVMSLLFLREAKRRRITLPGGADVRQAYAYVPDWARAAVMLADLRETLPTFADIPFPGHSFTAQALKDTIEAETGKPFTFTRLPWWLMTALSPVMELAREMREMRYLYEMDHWLDGTLFARLLPEFTPTPLTEVMLAGLPGDIHPNKPVRTGGKTVLAQ